MSKEDFSGLPSPYGWTRAVKILGINLFCEILLRGQGWSFSFLFFLFDFGLSVVRMPLSSVFLRCTPEQLSVTMSLLRRALFGDRDVS